MVRLALIPCCLGTGLQILAKFRTVCMELQVTSCVTGFNCLLIFCGRWLWSWRPVQMAEYFRGIFLADISREKFLLKDRRSIRSPYIPFVPSSSGNCCIHMCAQAGRKHLLLEVYQTICVCFSNGWCVMLIAFRCKARREFDADGKRTMGWGKWGNNRWFLTHSCIMQMRFFVCDGDLYKWINILYFLIFNRR